MTKFSMELSKRHLRHRGLPFRPHEQFRKADLDARCELYRQLAKQVWNPEDLLVEQTQEVVA